MTRLERIVGVLASSVVGGFVLLCADWLVSSHWPFDAVLATVGRVGFVTLLASPVVAIALFATSWSKGRPRATWIVAAVLAVVGGTGALELSAFLLSGPKWATHVQRDLLVPIGAAIFGLFAAATYMWTRLGTPPATVAADQPRPRPIVTGTWFALSVSALVVYVALAQRLRVYDYAFAWTLPFALWLASALVWRVCGHRGARRLARVLAGAIVVLAVITQPSVNSRTLGRRALAASSRLATIADNNLTPRRTLQEADSSTEGLQGALGCVRPTHSVLQDKVPTANDARRNVILISIDALRRDALAESYPTGPVAPNLRRIARAGVDYSRASSTYPATLYAMGSALTGWTPSELFMAPSLPPTLFTLARLGVDRTVTQMQDDAWFRLRVVRDFLLADAGNEYTKVESEVTDRFIERLEQARSQEETVLGWVHYFTPHDPYTKREAFGFGKGKRAAYHSEVALADREVGRLFTYFESAGWMKDTLFIVFSDHGEALGERNYWGHHVYLNTWTIDIPLTLLYPGAKPRTVHTRVSLLDIAPTALHFLGLPIPSDMVGQSLFSIQSDAPERATFAEAFSARHMELFNEFTLGIVDDAALMERLERIRTHRKGYEPKASIALGKHRLIHHRASGTTQLFDQLADPTEATNLKRRGRRTPAALAAAKEEWERAQRARIACRLWGTPQAPDGSGAAP